MKLDIRRYKFENRTEGGNIGYLSFEASEAMDRKEKSVNNLNNIGNASASACVVLFIALMGTGGFDIPKTSEVNPTVNLVISFLFTLFINPLNWLAIVIGVVLFSSGKKRIKQNKPHGRLIKWIGVIIIIGLIITTLYFTGIYL